MKPSDPLWETSDGRALRLSEMYTGHIGNARKVLRDWLKGEKDPELRKELKGWTRQFNKELRKRSQAWRGKHAR